MSTRTVIPVMALLLATFAAAAAPAVHAQAAQPLIILSPEPGERVTADAVLVAVSVAGAASALVEAGSLTLSIGGRDVTAQAELAGGVLTWRPQTRLAPGPHRVVATARDAAGAELPPVSWTFTVSPALSADVDATAGTATAGGWARPHGSILVEGAGSSLSGPGAPLRREPDFLPQTWLTAGGMLAPNWRYHARVHTSGYASADGQPLNRYRVELRGPRLSLAAGDVHPVVHDLILAGRRVRGAQAELRLGDLRLGMVYGESRRPVEGLLNAADPALLERPGAYGQRTLAVRPAIGSGRVFQAGVTVMSVRDDVESIPALRTAPAAAEQGSLPGNMQPKDNLVAGFDATLRLLAGRLLIQYENALSLLANDISGGPLTRAGLDSLLVASGNAELGLDPSRIERWFVVNASLVPLDPRGLSSTAHQFRTGLRAGGHQLAVEWRSVGGAYHSLGQPALQRDRRGVRVSDSFTLLDDALVVSIGAETDSDNLDGMQPATSTYRGGHLSLGWQPSWDGLHLTGSVRLGSRDNGLAAGAEDALDETNRAFAAGASVPVPLLAPLRTRVSLNASLLERSYAAGNAAGIRDVYLLGGVQTGTRDRTSEASVLLGVNRSELTAPAGAGGGGGGLDGKTDFVRVVASGRHRIAPRWTALADANHTAARTPGTDDGQPLRLHYDRFELLAGGEFAWRAASALGLTAGIARYTDGGDSGRDTRELRVRLRLSQAF